MAAHTVPVRTLIDARTTSIRITTLPPDFLPAPIREATSVPSTRVRVAEARPVRLLPGPAVRRRPRGAVRVAVAVLVVAAAGVLAGHARLGLSAMAFLGRVAVAVAVLVALAWIAARVVRVHCPGCRGVRR
jgi:hypothetical protein